MDFADVLRRTRQELSGLNEPARAGDLQRLAMEFGSLPEDVVRLYSDHNGANRFRQVSGRRPVARLMPIEEAIATTASIRRLGDRVPGADKVVWLWTDDNSNYAGPYTAGPFAGMVSVFDHEEQMLTPAFRSIAAFMVRILNDDLKTEPEPPACDIPSMDRDIPELIPNDATAVHDRQLSLMFREQYEQATDRWMRRFCAFCSICLTPFRNSDDVTSFFQDEDMWIPEAAVRLLELREWKGGVNALETLARDGRPNGDAAAIRALARMNTEDSKQALARLRACLTAQKLKVLDMWTSGRIKSQSVRW
jgi:hypothetical protein